MKPSPGHQRQAWLGSACKALNVAAAVTYGWTSYTPEMPDNEILRQQLALNLERASQKSWPHPTCMQPRHDRPTITRSPQTAATIRTASLAADVVQSHAPAGHDG